MVPLKVSSEGQLFDTLRKRKQQWEAFKASAVLTVPPELAWWYFQEVGTAPYPIDPVRSKELIFPVDGDVIHTEHVDFPGLKPRRSVTKVLPEIEEKLKDNISLSLTHYGALDDPETLREAVIQSVRDAKELIVKSISQNLPGLREFNPEYPEQQGKLGGRTAAEVFEEKSTVVAGE